VGQEIALCQRYYYRIQPGLSDTFVGNGYGIDAVRTYNIIPFPVKMRAAPSALEQSGTAGHYATHTGVTGTTCNGVPTHSYANQGCASVQFNFASGITASHAHAARFINSSAFLAWSAEL